MRSSRIPLIYPVMLLCLLSPESGNSAVRKGRYTPAPEPEATDSLTRMIEQERKQTEEWLKTSPSSYLATIHRVDFGDRPSLTVGREEGNDVRIDDPEIFARHLQVTVRGDSFQVKTLDGGAVFSVKGVRMSHALLPPSAISIGRYTVRLSHQRFPALIVFDPSSPRFKEYKGLKYFPVDLRYRYVLPLKPNPKGDTVVILSTRGNRRKALRRMVRVPCGRSHVSA